MQTPQGAACMSQATPLTPEFKRLVFCKVCMIGVGSRRHGQHGEIKTRFRESVLCIKPPHWRVTTPSKHTVDGGLLGVHDQAPFGRQSSHPVMKLSLNGREVGKNVGVVKLKVV